MLTWWSVMRGCSWRRWCISRWSSARTFVILGTALSPGLVPPSVSFSSGCYVPFSLHSISLLTVFSFRPSPQTPRTFRTWSCLSAKSIHACTRIWLSRRRIFINQRSWRLWAMCWGFIINWDHNLVKFLPRLRKLRNSRSFSSKKPPQAIRLWWRSYRSFSRSPSPSIKLTQSFTRTFPSFSCNPLL